MDRSRLRIHHEGLCFVDHNVDDYPTWSDITTWSHQAYSYHWYRCKHKGTWYHSNVFNSFEHDHYFLQMKNDSDHAGPGFGSPLEWIVYAHVYISGVEQVTIQYWFFWPYNDQFNNHEGDWEHINVVVNVSNEAYPYATQLVYWHHTTYTVVQPSQVQWVDTYHPRVFTASGSHANYPNKSSCDSAEFPWGRGCSSHAAEQWWTWADGKGSNAGWQGGGTLNMGERNHPFFSMDWIDYGGRWGELGTVPGTSGPPGPAAKEDSIWFQ